MTCDMWFGTQERAGWIQTPQTGADVSPGAWGESGVFLDGGAYAFNSFNSHKRYVFNWRTTSSKAEAQKMMSYYSGTFGRGKLYFQDPLTYDTNVLPARWADPSITCEFEGDSLIPGVEPVSVAASTDPELNLPVRSARYDLSRPLKNPVFREVVKASNYFPNPRLKGSGAFVTLRRNIVRDQRFNSSANWAPVRASVTATGTGVGVVTVTQLGEFPRMAQMQDPAVASGDYVLGAVRIASSHPGVTHVARLYFFNSSNTLVGSTPATTGTEPGAVLEFGGEAPAGATKVQLVLGALDNAAVGTKVAFESPTVEINPSWRNAGVLTPGDPLIGVDPDFRLRWEGGELGPSVLDAETVRGMNSTRCAAVVSSVEGKPAVRLIPLNHYTQASDSWSFTTIPVPAKARGGGVARATFHISQPRTGTTSLLGIRMSSPNQDSPITPPEQGTTELTRSYTALTATFALQLWHGGAAGSGDVKVTDIGIFTPGYTGPVFNGSTGTIPGDPVPLGTRWEGEEDNSESQAVTVDTTQAPSFTGGNSLYVPIPDGMELHVGGWFAEQGGAGVFVTSSAGGKPTSRTFKLQPNLDSPFTLTISKNPGEDGAYLYLAKTLPGAASLTLNALHARLSRVGDPVGGENHWIGGQGNEGVRFEGPPTYINHTGRDGGQVEFAATFVESVM